MVEKSQLKHQSFVLFWLGLLTGALLILAFYSLDNADLEGRLRGRSPVQYEAPLQYSVPADTTYSLPADTNFISPRYLKSDFFMGDMSR